MNSWTTGSDSHPLTRRFGRQRFWCLSWPDSPHHPDQLLISMSASFDGVIPFHYSVAWVSSCPFWLRHRRLNFMFLWWVQTVSTVVWMYRRSRFNALKRERRTELHRRIQNGSLEKSTNRSFGKEGSLCSHKARPVSYVYSRVDDLFMVSEQLYIRSFHIVVWGSPPTGPLYFGIQMHQNMVSQNRKFWTFLFI